VVAGGALVTDGQLPHDPTATVEQNGRLSRRPVVMTGDDEPGMRGRVIRCAVSCGGARLGACHAVRSAVAMLSARRWTSTPGRCSGI